MTIDWVSKKKRKWFRPFLLYFLIGTIFILFFGLTYNVFRHKGLKWIKNISWPMDRGTEKFAYAYVKEKTKPILRYKITLPKKTVSPSLQDSAGPELIQKDLSAPQSAPIKTYHQKEPQKTEQKKIKKVLAPALENPVLVEDVTFRIAQKGIEIVFIHSNRFFMPVIFALEGNRPRVVVDIKNTSHIKKGLSKIDVGGELIKQIRSHHYRDSQMLRIVLDLNPSKNYITNQIFYDSLNIYSLEIMEENRLQEAVLKDKNDRPEEIMQTLHAEQKVEDKEVEKIKLRRMGGDLNERNVREALYKYNFHSTCGGYNGDFCNPDGRFDNLFIDNNNDTVTDRVTGLMWEKSGSFTVMTWEEAKEYVRKLNLQNFAGYSDWRLPTLEELASLLESSWENDDLFIEAVFDKNQKSCWSADTHGPDKAWKANYHLGYIIDAPLTYKNSARAVRSHNYDSSLSNRTRGFTKSLYSDE